MDLLFQFRIVLDLGGVGEEVLQLLEHFRAGLLHLVVLGGDGGLSLPFSKGLDDILGPVAVELGGALGLRGGGRAAHPAGAGASFRLKLENFLINFKLLN